MHGDITPFNQLSASNSHEQSVHTRDVSTSSAFQIHQDTRQPSSQTTDPPELTIDLLGLPTRKGNGLWKLWLSLTTPIPQSESMLSPRTRERQRHMQLLSALLLIATIMMLVILPRGFVFGLALYVLAPAALTFTIIGLCIFLNQRGYITVAGTIFVSGTFCAVAASLISSPDGIDMANRANFYIFALPIIISSILLPRRLAVLTWLACSLFIILDPLFEQHSSDMKVYIAQVGIYGVVITPLITLAVVAIISWIAASSVERALMEADRTQELKHAYQLLEHSNQLLEAQKLRLEAAATAIQQVHARAANGDLQARATVKEGELVPLAASLNLMLERLAHSRAAELAFVETQHNIDRLALTISQMEQGQFDQQVPQQGWGPLTPAALHLEELRRTIVQYFQQSRLLTERVQATSQSLVQTTRPFLTVLRQPENVSFPVSRERAARIERTQKEHLNAIERLRQFLE